MAKCITYSKSAGPQRSLKYFPKQTTRAVPDAITAKNQKVKKKNFHCP